MCIRDRDPDDATDISANNIDKMNIGQGADTGVSWRDDSPKHQVHAHQYHRTRGNIAFRAPKFFRDGPDVAAAPTSSAPAVDVGGSLTKFSAIMSPLSCNATDSPSSSTPSPGKYSTAVTAAVVSSDIAKEGGEMDHDFLSSKACLLYTSPSPRDRQKSRMPSSA